MASLLVEAEKLPHWDESAVYSLRLRTKMSIRRIFGSSSPHLKSLGNIRFYLVAVSLTTTQAEENEVWLRGHSAITSLIRTMIEEWILFESAPTPILTIKDEELHQRTSDLLSAPGNYDRVLREATTILEDRLRGKVPFEDLAKLIPNASDQTGENLVNKLLNPSSPIVVIGDRQEQNKLFRMLSGTIAYWRNPSHHSVDDNIEWSWAWSAVGLIDQLLGDLESASYHRPSNLSQIK